MAELHAAHTAINWPDLGRSDAAEFWAGCAARELRFIRCGACNRPDFPPAGHCRECLSTDLRWEVSAGLGVLYSWTVVWRAPTPDLRTPYAPAIVDLDEGYRMLTNLVGIDSEAITPAMRVQVAFTAVGGGHELPCFRPADQPS
jgi:uncharacterized protein